MKFKDTKFGDLTGQHYVGNIDIEDLEITSLEGSPKTITGSFKCRGNELTSLEGAPEEVTGSFDCSYNELKSLSGIPMRINVDILSIAEARGFFPRNFSRIDSSFNRTA